MKTHSVTYWGKYAPEAYVSNGVIGFRFGRNPFTGALGLLAGFTALRERVHVEAMAVLPTPQLAFEADGQTVEPEILEQSYDFSNGEFTTKAKLPCGGGDVTVTYMVYCSRTSPTLLMSHLTFAGSPAKIAVNVSYAVRDEHQYTLGEAKCFEGYKNLFDGKCLQYSSDRSTSAGIAFRIFGDVHKEETGGLRERAEVDVIPEGTEIQLVTSYITSVMHSEPHNQAQRMIQLSAWQGVERLREANRRAWAKLWESRITVGVPGRRASRQSGRCAGI